MTWKTAHGGWLWLALAIVLVGTLVLIGALMRLPTRARRSLMVFVVFVSGLFYALEFFWPTHKDATGADVNFLTNVIPDFVSPFANILGALLLGLGIFSLARIHVTNVARRRAGWVNSAALIVAFFVMMFFGFWSQAAQVHPKWTEQVQGYLFNGIFQNMDAAMFSLISFYILSAAYRAFRIRSAEASILMASALIVLLGLSFGVLITQRVPSTGMAANLRIETWGQWILNTLSSPALRAIDFGVGLGGLAMGLRLWLGIERGALFGD